MRIAAILHPRAGSLTPPGPGLVLPRFGCAVMYSGWPDRPGILCVVAAASFVVVNVFRYHAESGFIEINHAWIVRSMFKFVDICLATVE